MALQSQKSDQNNYDYYAKILILGDSGVGKTNILLQFCEGTYRVGHIATVGIDFQVKTVKVKDSLLKLQIWDTAGQEKFQSITTTMYKGVSGVMLGYSVTDKQSFENVSKWMKQIKTNAVQDVCLVLLANKCDVDTAEREVTLQEGENLAKFYQIPFMETSAKENINIQECFQKLGYLIIEKAISNEQFGKQVINKIKLSENSKLKPLSGGTSQNTSDQLANCCSKQS